MSKSIIDRFAMRKEEVNKYAKAFEKKEVKAQIDYQKLPESFREYVATSIEENSADILNSYIDALLNGEVMDTKNDLKGYAESCIELLEEAEPGDKRAKKDIDTLKKIFKLG